MTAWRGIYTWGYENSDGTQTEIRADIDYPRVWRYEFPAHWDVPGEYQGIVRYCFYGTYRVPMTGIPGYEMDVFYLDIPLFLERIQAADFDWSIALSVSEEYTFYLLL